MAEALGKEMQLREKVLQLQTMLLSAHPQMPILLQQIHKNLKDDDELVHFLSEDEIGAVVACLSQHKNIVIASNVINSRSTKSMKNITLEDL